MKVIAFSSEKGGAGKSTLTASVACALHRQGSKVVILDCDPQGSARDWRAASPEGADLPTVMAADRAELIGLAVKGLDADYVLIDCPAKADKISAAALRAADVVLVPVQPSGLDAWAASATVKQIDARRDAGGQLLAAFIVNRAATGTNLTKQIQAGDWSDGLDVQQLDTAIGNRTAFAQAMTMGISIFDLQDAKAKDEINALIKELKAAEWL